MKLLTFALKIMKFEFEKLEIWQLTMNYADE